MLKKKLNRAEIIRVGDRVKITNPEFFVRCGYPLNKELILRNELKQEDISKIDKFIESFGLSNYYFADAKASNIHTRVFDKIADAIAYGLLNKNGFGGRERKIYTELLEPYKDTECFVIGRKVVNTGHYRAGSASYGEDYDWEPAYLEQQKTHLVYTLDIYVGGKDKFLQIEKKNLEKL